MQDIETNYDGHRFRSRTEARWAVFFNALGWRYQYEGEGVIVERTPYLPDFYLPEIDSFLEVKGTEPTEEEIQLCRDLQKASGKRVLLAIGPPDGNGLLWFGRELWGEGDSDDRLFSLEADRRDEGVFWLAALDGGLHSCIGGPGKQSNHDRYPGRYGKIGEAYAAAKAARFEHGEKG